MPSFCATCGSELTEGASFCQACGKPVAPANVSVGTGAAVVPTPTSTTATTGGLADNVAGMLAYVTIIPAIVFLLIEPYKNRLFVRFHAFQCLFFALALFVLHFIVAFIPFVGFWVLSPLVSLAGLALWIICLIKANSGEMWKIPYIGDFAEKQAKA